MKVLKRNWFEFVHEPKNVLFWTGNLSVTNKGKAVMGRGLAKQVLEKYPGIDVELGQQLSEISTKEIKQDLYGNKVVIKNPALILVRNKIGMFPVKFGWWEQANLNLIAVSCKGLSEMAARNKSFNFYVNYPGIGAGMLKEVDVEVILNKYLIGENVFVLKGE